MLRKTFLSIAAGVLFTALLSAAPAVNAACQGFCADRHIANGCVSDYAGCTIHYDANDNPMDAECFYVNTCAMEAQ